MLGKSFAGNRHEVLDWVADPRCAGLIRRRIAHAIDYHVLGSAIVLNCHVNLARKKDKARNKEQPQNGVSLLCLCVYLYVCQYVRVCVCV